MGEGDCNFYKVSESVSEGGIPVSKYKSRLTGITVCIAKADGPIVAGYLTIATEAHDDDGLPHTLEHLVFMGSEKYSYKGVLDLLANRCLASGTNAWTDTDHTCYTMTTAGHEGFLNLLPIYLDHLLYPTLSDAAFTTEVHHIDGEGEDAGIVYCEMQARENSGESRCQLALLRAIYPGHCGYKSETGGMMKNLRESTSNEKVCAYHKEFYRPENLSVIIVGQIEAEQVFSALEPVESRILNDGDRGPFTKPWQSPVPPLEESSVFEIPYPCDEEKHGLFMASWRGPYAKDIGDVLAVQVLMEYLTDTSISPLQREFVENESPYCNDVSFNVTENSECLINLMFSNVPVEKLGDLKDKLFEVLTKLADGTEVIDMDRMATTLHKKKLHILEQMESNPHEQLALWLIVDFLYGTSNENLHERLRPTILIDKLALENKDYWSGLIKKHFLDGTYVMVSGRPSSSLAEEMSKEETERIAKQRELLGSEGLKEKEEALEKAIMANEIPPPAEMLQSVPVPSVESLKFFTIHRGCNYPCNSQCECISDFSLQKMPCRFQLDDIQSIFVRMDVLMDTSDLPPNLRLYLPLYIELIMESPMNLNGEVIPYETIVEQLRTDTVSHMAMLGRNYSRFSCQNYEQVVSVSLMVEEEKYAAGVRWLRDILFNVVFDPPRIKTIINKMITDVSEMKRNGSSVASVIAQNMCFGKESNHRAASMLRQQTFLAEVLQTLDSVPYNVVDHLKQLQDFLNKEDKITVHLSGNIKNLKQKQEVESLWHDIFLSGIEAPTLVRNPVKLGFEYLLDMSEADRGFVAGIGSIESSFLIQCAPCIASYTDPDYPALRVLIQYLTQLEGPMWKQIRGLGLSYSYSIILKPEAGLIYFVLFKSASLVKAYKEGKAIVDNHLNGTTDWDSALMESACSSLMYNIIVQVKSVADVTEQSLTAYYKNVDMSYTKTLLEAITKVTESDMKRVGSLYLKPLFSPEKSCCAICCPPSKVEDIVNGFSQMSRNLTVIQSLDESFIAQL